MKNLSSRALAGASRLILAAMTVLAGGAHAQEPRIDGRLEFKCHALQMPSQRDVARLLGMHNLTQAYRERERLMQGVRRDCLAGATRVLVESPRTIDADVIVEPENVSDARRFSDTRTSER